MASSSSLRKTSTDFIGNKPIFSKIFFNKYENMPLSRIEVDEFWLFLTKYLIAKKSSDKRDNPRLAESLLAKLQEDIPTEWTNEDFLRGQLKEFRCSNYIRYSDLEEFRNVLLMFIDFNNKRKEKKLEKLRKLQQNLPIYKHEDEIIKQMESYSVILIAGDTGCGKSTQVPQYLLKANYEKICCTQPRRIACISLRNRLAYETLNQYGSEIGYQIRFEKYKSKTTKVLFLTEGLLLRQMIEDPLLSNYNVIILDEIHERHLSCDFLLGAIKCLLNKRKNDLKVILMSATVNCDLFSNYFGNCPVIKVPGRLYPIKTEYFPVKKFESLRKTSKINPEPYLKLLHYIDDKYSASERGDVLVFLSGFMEIETVGEVLKTYAEQSKKWIILYLHSSLSVAEQDKVFDIAPEGTRKCILSTNIAETSLTIDGIRFVIDSGKVKEMNYDSKIRMHKLQEIWISKASAEQRKGRAGRTGPGICYRLYSPKDFEEFENFSKPEIQRVSLESLILNMISMGLQDVRKFPFLESPDAGNIENTLKCLVNYGTLDAREKITVFGKILSKLPVDISIGKMLILGIGFNLAEYLLSAASCLSVHSLVTTRSANNSEAIEERKALHSLEGDIFTYSRFYSKWLSLKSDHYNTRSWCRKLGLEEQRFFEVTKLRNQFKQILTDTGLMQSVTKSDEESSLRKSERILKHGERKLYHQLRTELEKHKNKKRRVLDVNEDQDAASTSAEANVETDFKDVEFKLLFDGKHLNDIERRLNLKFDDIQIVKLIVSMSFYPQMAIADQDNSFRMDSDQMFHTKDKSFVMIHPSSVYYSQPEVLRSLEVEHSPIGALSQFHFLLGYISFIETNKTYICNCYKISAVHALLLCSNELDSNKELTRIICDSWIEMQFASSDECQTILIKAFQVRQSWSRLMEKILNDLLEKSDEDDGGGKSVSANFGPEIHTLRQQIKDFLALKVAYTIKRMLAADLTNLYTGTQIKRDDVNKDSYPLLGYLLDQPEIQQDASFGVSKGGIRLQPFFTYNCLRVNEMDEMVRSTRKLFHCVECGNDMHLSSIERARHEEICPRSRHSAASGNVSIERNQPSDPSSGSEQTNSIHYYCEHCNQSYRFASNIDVLKHKQTHRK